MSKPDRSVVAVKKGHNRILAIMAHIPRYSFRGTSRLAADAKIAKSTVSHLIRGMNNPLYITICRVVKCLEIQLGRALDYDEVISVDGRYPTNSVCQLCACPGCLPDSVYESDGSRRSGFESVVPGHWTGDIQEFSSDKRAEQKDPGTE